jgi:hypothetical protein
MESRPRLAALAVFCGALLIVSSAQAAGARSQHFMVQAPTKEQAERVAKAAEAFRRDLAIEWLGHELPPWPDVCPIVCDIAPQNPAGGATSFIFQQGQPRAWQMSVQGTEERVLDSVLPHEITHTIFATHFGRPLPRWADEGACTTVEHESEISKHRKLLVQFLHTNKGIPFNKMFAMMDYPRDILPLYSQGHSVSNFLIQQGGRRKYIKFVEDGLSSNRWPEAVQRHYGFPDLSELQLTWVEWVREGEPPVTQFQDERFLAAADRVGGADPELLTSRGRPAPNTRSNQDIAALSRRPSRGERPNPRYNRERNANRDTDQDLAPIQDMTSRRGVRPASALEPIDSVEENDDSQAYDNRPPGRLSRRDVPANPMRPRGRTNGSTAHSERGGPGFYSRMREAADRGLPSDEDDYEDSNEMTVTSRPVPPQGMSTKVLEQSRGGGDDRVRPASTGANRYRRVPVEQDVEIDGREIEQGILFDAPIPRKATIRR